MNVTNASLQSVDGHWAVQAMGDDLRDKAMRRAEELLAQRALGEQFHFSFAHTKGHDEL